MSKAFTRDDADASFEAPARSGHHAEARLTAYGARLARERLADLERHGPSADGALASDRLRELLERAAIVDPAGAGHVALGARVRVRSEDGKERAVVLATPDEVGLIPSAISAGSPLGQALVGASEGETVEVDFPRGTEELTVVSIDWPL